MNKDHNEILSEIKKEAKNRKSPFVSSDYSGSSHPRYCLSVPESRRIAKKWTHSHREISYGDFLNFLSSLYKGKSINEKTIAGQFLQYFPSLRLQINPVYLKKWLRKLEGWEEIDSLCQSVFSAKDLAFCWMQWRKIIKELSGSKIPSYQRASLVLLTGPVRQSNDMRFADLSFENIEKLKSERDPLITKAISWLLRELIKNHKSRVTLYLKRNAEVLPRIVVRETHNKLAKGRE